MRGDVRAPVLLGIRRRRAGRDEALPPAADLRGRRAAGVSLASHLGATHDRVPCGVSVGIANSIAELLDQVDGYLAQGYRRIKLKIEPGWDVDPVREVRERFGDILLQVDANAAYTVGDAPHLARLDEFDL